MSYGPPAGHGPAHGQPPSTEVSLSPEDGWHCTHSYYRFNRAALKSLTAAELNEGKKQFAAILDPAVEGRPTDVKLQILMEDA